jgi:hypothetical protein
LFGLVLFPALAANNALAILHRRERGPFRLALAASIPMAVMLGSFFVWIYPANVATQNWTAVPANWSEIRAQWEYSHAANAVLTFTALCAASLSVLLARG